MGIGAHDQQAELAWSRRAASGFCRPRRRRREGWSTLTLAPWRLRRRASSAPRTSFASSVTQTTSTRSAFSSKGMASVTARAALAPPSQATTTFSNDGPASHSCGTTRTAQPELNRTFSISLWSVKRTPFGWGTMTRSHRRAAAQKAFPALGGGELGDRAIGVDPCKARGRFDMLAKAFRLGEALIVDFGDDGVDQRQDLNAGNLDALRIRQHGQIRLFASREFDRIIDHGVRAWAFVQGQEQLDGLVRHAGSLSPIIARHSPAILDLSLRTFRQSAPDGKIALDGASGARSEPWISSVLPWSRPSPIPPALRSAP